MDALNYPYIRVRDVDWLKRTLLLFPHVVRMTPRERAPADDPEVEPFTWIGGARGPLLRPARLHGRHVHEAQLRLVRQLERRLSVEGDVFLDRFGRRAARAGRAGSIARPTVWERRLAGGATFQIHAWKLFEELVAFLLAHRLAWEPPDELTDGPEYLEMHPRLGEAVMATLATACAENEGLQVVTEFPELHGRLLGTPRDKILDACIGRDGGPRPVGAAQVAEFFVHRVCDVGVLDADGLVALGEEREALAAFRGKLEQVASTLPPVIEDVQLREERIGDLLQDVFREWEREQANLGPGGRRFFADGVLPEAGRVAEKLVEAALKPDAAATAAAGTAVGKALAPAAPVLSAPVLTFTGAGFAVAVLFREVERWRDARRAARSSPLRYLTALRGQGVSFSFAGEAAPLQRKPGRRATVMSS